MNDSFAASGPELGKIGRSHGLLGAMRVHPVSTVACEALAHATHVWIDGLGETPVVSFAPHGTTWLLRVARIRRVDDAKRLVDASVRAVSDGPSETNAQVGTDVQVATVDVGSPVTVDGRPLGTVTGILGPTLHAVARVDTGGGDVLIPLTAPYVSFDGTTVNVVDPPQGLLDPT